MITDQEVANAFEGLAKQNKVSADKFQRALKHKGVPVDSLKRQLRAQIAWSRVVQSQIAPRVVVTDNDVDATLQRRDGMIGKDEYLVAEIFLPVPTEDKDAEVVQSAQRLIKEVRGGRADFGAVAQRFSQAATAANGGQIGWVLEGSLAPELDEVLPTLNKGEVSNPIKTDEGYTVLMLRDKRAALNEANAQQSADAEAIRQGLGNQRIEIMARRYLRDLRSVAYIETRIDG